MVDTTSTESRTDEAERRTITRRDLLKATGGTGVGIVGLAAVAGTATAAQTPDQLYFCGCSQMVVTGLSKTASVTVYLRATEEGGCTTATVSSPDCFVGEGREYAFGYTVSSGQAILAIETPDGNLWCNPNNCAEKWIDECGLRSRCTPYSNLDSPGDVFTNRCGTVCSGGGPPQ